ncbi:MAG TPA: hypothetical protein VGR85_09060 [Candidatus Limnocylindria bacterium]|nr:hypothetical protein [Candidatus Limnocylindria bacterium]
MAIDTRNKRSSAVFVTMPWRAQLPAPDGAIGQGDRQAVAFMYSGILATAAGGATLIAQVRGIHRPLFARIFGRVN